MPAKTEIIQVRVTEKEKRRIVHEAKKAKVGVSELIRAVLFEKGKAAWVVEDET